MNCILGYFNSIIRFSDFVTISGPVPSGIGLFFCPKIGVIMFEINKKQNNT